MGESFGQLVAFVIVGLIQVFFDAQILVLLVGLGVPVGLANVMSRFLAALIGYGLNSIFTFSQGRAGGLHGTFLVRYLMLWVSLTFVGSVALELLDFTVLLRVALAKIVIEIFLAFVSFVAMKFWVFRR